MPPNSISIIKNYKPIPPTHPPPIQNIFRITPLDEKTDENN